MEPLFELSGTLMWREEGCVDGLGDTDIFFFVLAGSVTTWVVLWMLRFVGVVAWMFTGCGVLGVGQMG